MTIPLTCDLVADAGLIERYVAGRLSDDESARLETHYLTCARCQDDIRLATAIRAAGPPRRRTTAVPWLPISVAALAAGVVLVVLARSGPSAAMTRLGTVRTPPVYLGIEVRGPGSAGDSLFEAAMRDYAAARYDSAASGLEAALRAGVDSAPAEFFLGASRLVAGANDGAAEAFRRVIALGPTPYLAEAHFYLAKALLRQGRAGDALDQLGQVGQADEAVSAEASELADSVRSHRR